MRSTFHGAGMSAAFSGPQRRCTMQHHAPSKSTVLCACTWLARRGGADPFLCQWADYVYLCFDCYSCLLCASAAPYACPLPVHVHLAHLLACCPLVCHSCLFTRAAG